MRQVQGSHVPFLGLGVVWVRVCAVVLCKVGGSLLGREGFCLSLLHTLGCESCPACASPWHRRVLKQHCWVTNKVKQSNKKE